MCLVILVTVIMMGLQVQILPNTCTCNCGEPE